MLELIKFYSRINIFELLFSLLEHFLTTRYQFHPIFLQKKKRKKHIQYTPTIAKSPNHKKIQKIQFISFFFFFFYKEITSLQQSLNFSRFFYYTTARKSQRRSTIQEYPIRDVIGKAITLSRPRRNYQFHRAINMLETFPREGQYFCGFLLVIIREPSLFVAFVVGNSSWKRLWKASSTLEAFGRPSPG